MLPPSPPLVVLSRKVGNFRICFLPRHCLDQIDVRILTILQEDGRLTNKVLSERVNLSPRPCLERVRRLQKAGFIKRFSAVLTVEKFGDPVTIFSHISLNKQGVQVRGRFEQTVAQVEEVVECHEVSGYADFIARLVCPSLPFYYDLTNGWLQNEKLDVRRIETSISLRPVVAGRGLPLSVIEAVWG